MFIAATATSLVATAFLGSLLKGPGFLAGVAIQQNRLLAAALFQFLAAFTSAAIAATLYPVLRQHAEPARRADSPLCSPQQPVRHPWREIWYEVGGVQVARLRCRRR